MSKVTSYQPGTFSWVELGTTDSDAAKKFYGALFDWTFEDMPAGPGMIYTMFKRGADYAGALYALGGMPNMKDVPPHWESYITVESVDATATLAKDAGGTLLKEPFDVFDVGRMAVIKDPTGGVFCVWQAKKHIGAGVVNEPGALAWSELYTPDPEQAGKFYSKVIGWVLHAVDMGPMGTYTLFKDARGGDDSKGGMLKPTPEMGPVPPHWLAYLGVVNCDASAKKVSELGGKLLLPPTDIPNIGRFAITQDPQGAVFALYQHGH
ncbi:MAG TPA: VOC family protein [Polyangiaceae bacterium]